LALDIYDSAGHDLVWRGAVGKTIDPNAKTRKAAEELGKKPQKAPEKLSAAGKKMQLPHRRSPLG
jgi:hypothetical protein